MYRQSLNRLVQDGVCVTEPSSGLQKVALSKFSDPLKRLCATLNVFQFTIFALVPLCVRLELSSATLERLFAGIVVFYKRLCRPQARLGSPPQSPYHK